METTFNQLKELEACEHGYRKLAKSLGGITKYGKDTPINLSSILASNGIDDCFWVIDLIELTPDQKRDFIVLACGYAEPVLPIFEKEFPNDSRPRDCIEVAKRHADGKADNQELATAGDAARAAARDAWASAGDNAGDAARASAWDAARDAAWAASRASAGDAARDAWDAARDAAWAAAWDAAWDAERSSQSKMLMELLKRYEQ